MKNIGIQIWGLLLIILPGSGLISQPINNTFGDVTLPSYQAASLGKFGEIPVSYFRGVPSIGIDIYSVNQGSLSLPISVDYHASGIRVAEIASWVGLGWTLNAGGMISRSVVGIEDEDPNGWFNLASITAPPHQGIAEGLWDSEPDMFNFNVLGYSGKFVFNINVGESAMVEPMIIPRQDIKITRVMSGGSLNGFKMILPNGVICHFGMYGGSTAHETSAPANNVTGTTTGWYLMRMVSHDLKHAITLTYETERHGYRYPASAEYFSITEQTGCGINGTAGTRYLNIDNSPVGFNFIVGKRLTNISNSAGTISVDFKTNAGDTRQDVDLHGSNPARPLDKIEIYNGSDSKVFDFSYSYFTSPMDNNDIGNGNTSSSWYKRLKLDSIEERSLNGLVSKPAYEFGYLGGSSGLPQRLSRQVDHWGFYNGQTFNLATVNVPPTIVGSTSYGTAKRDSRESYMKNGVLDEVIYPSKGYTLYTYGANRYYYPIDEASNLVSRNVLRTCSVGSGEVCCDYVPPGGPKTGTTFNLSTEEISGAEIELDIVFGDLVTGNCNGGPKSITLKLYRDGVTPEIGSISFTEQSGDPEQAPMRFDVSTEFPTLVSGGTFYFTLQSYNAGGLATMYAPEAEERDVGGLRLEAISHYDDNDVLLNSATYEYTKKGSSESSGVLYVEPVYGAEVVDENSLVHVFIRDMSVVPLAGFDGYHIGYERVTEKKPNNGSTVYIHTVEPRTQVETYPQIPDLFLVKNGQQDSTSVFNQAGTLLQRSANTYLDAYQYLPTNPFKLFYFKHFDPFFQITCYYYRKQSYNIRTGYNVHGSNREYVDGMLSYTNYEYLPLVQLLPVAENITNSDGKVHRTEYSYPSSYGAGSIKNKLLDQNRIVPAYKTIKKVDGLLVDGDSTKFSFFNASGIPTGSTTTLLYSHQKYRYEYTWDNTGTPIVDGWKLQSTVDEVQSDVGMPAEVTIDGWDDPIELTWSTSGKMKKWKFIAHKKIYDYHTGSDLLKKYTAVDLTTLDYNWDALMRLKDVTDSKGVKTDLGYFYQSGSVDNRIDQKTTYPKLGSLTTHSLTTTTFFDDLGKTIQQLRWKQHPDNATQSIAEQTVYDALARPIQQHEPVLSTASPSSYASALNDYTVTTYEASPLARPIKVTPPQDLASTKLGEITYQYGTNTSFNEVYNYNAGANYPINSLHKVIQTDANGIETITYTDILGNEVLVRRHESAANSASTYKRYDDKNRLTIIHPPEVTSTSNNLHFRMLYSGDDQLVHQDDPDQGPEVFFYDDRELLVSRQDTKMVAQNRIYQIDRDAYGRSIKEGFSDQEGGVITDVMIENTYGTAGVLLDKLVQQKKKVLNSGQFITTNYLFDSYGRNTITRYNSVLHAGIDAIVDSLILDDADNVLEAHHKVKPESLEIRNTNGYDHAGRHVDTKIRVTTDGTQWPEEDLCNKRHTVKEQLKYVKLSGSLQQIDYVYRKNGYLHSINGSWDAQDLFFMELGYDNHVASQIPSGNQVKRYNGDISEIEWRYRNTGGSSTPFQNYNYKYNYLDMLTAADYYESGKNGHYTTSYTYKDDRGNFDKLTRRHANVLIDDLVYVKKTGSNLLEEIDDESGSPLGYKESTGYLHDGNGFITFDPEIGATITRDHLNHITSIALPNAIHISSSRDANGQLHRRIIDSAGVLTTIDRIGACEFRNGALSVIHHDNGYITMNRAAPEELYLTGTVSHTKTEQGVSITTERVLNAGANETNEAQEEIVMKPQFEVKAGAVYTAEIKEFPIQGLNYHYVIKDHLGSPRVVFQDVNNNNSIDFATDLEDVKNYYPFGLEWQKPTHEEAKYRNAYNNKERISHTKYLDFGARNYIKSANVFDGPDPINSDFPHITSIAYAENRPVNSIDLWGLQAWEINQSRRRGEVKVPSRQAEGDYMGPAIGGALSAMTLFMPGPEDVAAGAAMATKVGQLAKSAISKGFGKLKRLFGKGDDLPTIEFDQSTPNVSTNIREALEEGKPSVLSRETNKDVIAKNRREALRGKENLREQGTSLDEFPFASTKEGGSGARVKAVPVREQSVQGGKLSQFFQRNNIKQGDKFKVKVKDE